MSTVDGITPPELEFVFEIVAEIAPPYEIGRGVDEQLSFTPVLGGTVSGPRFSGTVLGGGGDWATLRSGSFELMARYLIKHDDGTVVDVLNRGYYTVEPEVEERIKAGEKIGPDECYFRTAPVFQTSAPQHLWLTRHQFVGVAIDDEPRVRIQVFLVR